jgi:hypothetical protein
MIPQAVGAVSLAIWTYLVFGEVDSGVCRIQVLHRRSKARRSGPLLSLFRHGTKQR